MQLITTNEVISYAFSRRELVTSSSINLCRIHIAQERYIAPRLGYELYDKICNGEFRDFTDIYIKPALAHYVRYLLIDEIQIQIGDNGCLVFSGHTDQTDKSEDNISTRVQDRLGNNTYTIGGYGTNETPGGYTKNEQQILNHDETQKTTDDFATSTTDKKQAYATAPPKQIHQLQIRALADANTIMSRAVRYVERNESMFGSFKGSPRHYF